MTVPAAAGWPQQSGILIPEIWSGKTLVKFYASCIMGSFCNTDYEGEISKQGDKVWIRTTPDIEIRNYNKGQPLNIQRPTPTKVSLNINRAKYWNVAIDDIDKFQSDLNYMEDWSRDAAEQLKITWDKDFLADIYADAHAKNKGAQAGLESGSYNLGTAGAPLALTKANVLDFLVDVGCVFDEQNVPENDRNIALPPWAIGLIKRSDLQDAALTGDSESPLRSGRVGRIDRLTLYSSNLLSSVIDTGNRCWNVLASQRNGITFASQLLETKVLDSELTFGKLARGLQVADWEGLKPEAIVHAYVRKG